MLSYNVVRPIRTVAQLLRRRRGARALLGDRDLPIAIAALRQSADDDDEARAAFDAAVAAKRVARQRLLMRYGGPSATHAPSVDDDLPPRANKKHKASGSGGGVLSAFSRIVGYGGASDDDNAANVNDDDVGIGASRPRLSIDELNLVIDSLSDAEHHQQACYGPVEEMLKWLQQCYAGPERAGDSLAISYGDGGSKLSHSHSQQVWEIGFFFFV